MDIAEKLVAQGYHIDRRKIVLDSPLKVLGEYAVPIRLHKEVTASIKVKIEGEKVEGEAAAQAPAKAEPQPQAQSEPQPPEAEDKPATE
jgi:large subunit ribosomal protein L9